MWRAAIIGIDGSGKTSTAVKLVQRLRGQLSICKPGRPPLVAAKGQPDTFMADEAAAMEANLRRADATGKRLSVVFSRRRYLNFVTRVERLMADRFGPDLMLLARCALVDPAVYAEFYLPRLSRLLSLERRLRLAAWSARVAPRQVYFHLDTPPDVAMARIDARLAQLNAADTSGREHWRHMHEQEETLAGLAKTMRHALEIVSRATGAQVMTINNAELRQDGVVELMAEHLLNLTGKARPRVGRRVSTSVRLRHLPTDYHWLLPMRPGDPAPDPRQIESMEGGGGRQVVLLGGEVLRYFYTEPDGEKLLGAYILDPDTTESVASVPGPPVDEPRDIWVVYSAREEQGLKVRMARLDGHGAAERWDPDTEEPGVLSRSTFVKGMIPGAAWGLTAAGEEVCLVAYVEPSRTQLWGLCVDHQSRVIRTPFTLASAEEEHLLCDRKGHGDIRVAFDPEAGHFTVTWASYRNDSDAPAQAHRLQLTPPDGPPSEAKKVELMKAKPRELVLEAV
jgi:thymidylate kinase